MRALSIVVCVVALSASASADEKPRPDTLKAIVKAAKLKPAGKAKPIDITVDLKDGRKLQFKSKAGNLTEADAAIVDKGKSTPAEPGWMELPNGRTFTMSTATSARAKVCKMVRNADAKGMKGAYPCLPCMGYINCLSAAKADGEEECRAQARPETIELADPLTACVEKACPAGSKADCAAAALKAGGACDAAAKTCSSDAG